MAAEEIKVGKSSKSRIYVSQICFLTLFVSSRLSSNEMTPAQ